MREGKRQCRFAIQFAQLRDLILVD